MEFKSPDCLMCPLFRNLPKCIGGKATCVAYPNGIPKKIFFEGGNCNKNPNKNRNGGKNGKRKK